MLSIYQVWPALAFVAFVCACSPIPLHAEKELYDAAKKAEQMAQVSEKESDRLRGATLSGSLRRRERRRPGLDEWMPQAFLNNEKQLKDLEKQVMIFSPALLCASVTC